MVFVFVTAVSYSQAGNLGLTASFMNPFHACTMVGRA